MCVCVLLLLLLLFCVLSRSVAFCCLPVQLVTLQSVRHFDVMLCILCQLHSVMHFEVDPEEENSPAAPTGTRTRDLSIVNPSLYR